MRQLVIVILILLTLIPVSAQDNGDIPLVSIPPVFSDSTTITVERYESGGYNINLGMDGQFTTWIGRDGNEVFYDDLQSVDGVINLPANNIWLINGNYVVWLCQTQCDGLNNWIGPVAFTVNDSRLTNLSGFTVDDNISSSGAKVSLNWTRSDLNSWYYVWAGLSSNVHSVGKIVQDRWYLASQLCTSDSCSVDLPTISSTSEEEKYLLIYVIGWGASGYNAQWNTVNIELPAGGCPIGTIEFPPGTGQCISLPGG